jgi:hypothetical protein
MTNLALRSNYFGTAGITTQIGITDYPFWALPFIAYNLNYSLYTNAGGRMFDYRLNN